MSISRNATANLASRLIATALAVVAMPFYLRMLGSEAFGAVGFFLMGQAWIVLFDLGLSPTLQRQVAYWKEQPGGGRELRSIFRTFERVVTAIAVVVCFGVYLGSSQIAFNWLNPGEIEASAMLTAVRLIGLTLAIRMLTYLYRAAIIGSEKQVWLGVVDSLFAVARYLGVVAAMLIWTPDLGTFFVFQAALAVVEILVYRLRVARIVSAEPDDAESPTKGVEPALWRFALSLGYTTAVWTAVTQTDRLVLSKVLSLTEFGYFSFVALAATALSMVTVPIANALLPRLTSLHAAGDRDGLVDTYGKATQVVAVFAVSIAAVLALYGSQIILVWSGDAEAATWAGPVLFWFALGHGLLAITAFQYFLQNAMGDLRLHVKGATVSAVVQIPAMVAGALTYGAVGAGIAWFVVRLLWFVGWTAIVHASLIPGLHRTWLLRDVLPVFLSGAAGAAVLANFIRIDVDLPLAYQLGLLCLAGGVQLLVTALGSSLMRELGAGALRRTVTHS